MGLLWELMAHICVWRKAKGGQKWKIFYNNGIVKNNTASTSSIITVVKVVLGLIMCCHEKNLTYARYHIRRSHAFSLIL